jgi:NADH-quinone oxidoreductase subunit L
MFRLYFLTFYGNFRGTHHQKEHLHESPATMTLPLILLAVLSTLGGFIGMPEIFQAPNFIGDFMSPVTAFADAYHMGHVSHQFEYVLIGAMFAALLVVIYFTYRKYVVQEHVPVWDSQLQGIQKLLANKFYVDEFYHALITKPVDFLSGASYRWIEKGLIDRCVNSIGQLTNGASSILRLSQQGNLGYYLFAMVFAVILMLTLMFVI